MRSIHSRLDAIYEWADRLMWADRPDKIDAVLNRLSTNDIDMLLGFLTATLPMRSRIPGRKRIYEMAQRRLIELGELDPTILSGLEAEK